MNSQEDLETINRYLIDCDPALFEAQLILARASREEPLKLTPEPKAVVPSE